MLLAENMTGASARFPVPENHYRTKRGAELSKYPPAEPRFDGCGYLIVAGSQPEGKFRISNKEFRTAEARPIRTSKFNIPCSIFCGSKCPLFKLGRKEAHSATAGKHTPENVKLLLPHRQSRWISQRIRAILTSDSYAVTAQIMATNAAWEAKSSPGNDPEGAKDDTSNPLQHEPFLRSRAIRR